jgi:hypothetical protein
VAIITDRFEETARAVAEANGLPAYRFALVPHPIADNDDAALREKAELAVRRLIPLLTGPGREGPGGPPA